MTSQTGLKPLINALREIDLTQNEEEIIQHVKPLVQQFISQPEVWFEDRFYCVDEEQGFGSHLVAENEDHTLAVIITSWPAHRETPPHDHDTWAVIGCIKGAEENILWNRYDDGLKTGYADIARGHTVLCRPGDVITMSRKDIHSVVNPLDDEISVSLHVYGKHFNYTNRHQYDPDKKTTRPFIVR